MGGWSERDIWPWEEIKSTKKLKLLGLSIQVSIEETTKEAWEGIYAEIIEILKENIGRKLVLQQRVRFIQVKVLPKAIYLAKVLPEPKQKIEEINKALLRFVWSGKMLRIKGEDCLKRQK